MKGNSKKNSIALFLLGWLLLNDSYLTLWRMTLSQFFMERLVICIIHIKVCVLCTTLENFEKDGNNRQYHSRTRYSIQLKGPEI